VFTLKKAIPVAIAIVGVALIGVYLTIASTPYKQLTPVKSNPDIETSARQKLDLIKSAEYYPEQQHKTARVTVTFTDEELTWLANWKAGRSGAAVDSFILHSTASGTVESQFNLHAGPMNFPVYMVTRPSVADRNRVQFKILESKWGRLDPPGPVVSQINQTAQQVYSASLEHTRKFDDIQLEVKEGQFTVTAVNNPK
jgi:hypothetical protein